MTTIYWAGDSTVQYNDIATYPQTGLGQALGLYLKRDIRIENHARNGRSTRSFLDESRLMPIYDRMTAGDFLFVQFGHNDEKIRDPARYTDPFGEYQINLGRFANAARNKGAHPVFITPLERRCFDESGVLGAGEHGEYVAGMKQAAEKLDVPLIDLWAKSRALLSRRGAEESLKWYMQLPAGEYENYPDGQRDNSHLQYRGAVLYAGCIAEGLRELGGIYAELLTDGKVDPNEFHGLEA